MPRVIAAAEWDAIATGLAQRARALNAFLADLYGERRIVAAGVVPARVIDLAQHHQPLLDGVAVPGGHTPLIGFDLVRGRDGVLRVLEDNLRTPSGLAYALAARQALDEGLAAASVELDATRGARLDIDPAVDGLAAVLEAARPPEGPELAVLLSDSIDAGARFEHDELGRRLGVAVVEPAALRLRGDVLLATVAGEESEVGVVLRRSDEELLVDATGSPNWVAGLFLEPLRAGRLTVVNGFGTGVADDKLTHAYVEAMIRFYLGEEPLVESVRTIDLTRPDERAAALERFEELVIKPRAGHGGYGVFIGAHARPEDRERIRREVERDPEGFVAQETVELSTHPTVHDGALEPRHVDLRAFAIGDLIVPGGLTRFARDRGAFVVNSSQKGGAKDTWVVAERAGRG
ncbi:circularly permuted type 2 ATP-grasp protein [Thermoleophilia bacterium SCSIO 60948]|nr:circularly permuted type 2 ATP-grasp protein [Thermoleophilia bacterium SCSIO 60948]